ncbi:hypothetical protein [Spiroplasma endosymbiont of Sarcophaga variegata]|uniref:hypothetical protein n=1 Tax=Spiroplasma endosymbiont of Sarcophaga variegata TaxID=3066304 RepID=UPI003AF68721
MNWDYYFIFDGNGTTQTLRCICKTAVDAKEALEDCYLDNKYNTDIVNQISFCLIFTFDNTTDNYELNKRATEEFIKELSVCQQCNRVKSKLDRNQLCSECESELAGIETFQCDLCKKHRLVRDDFNRELFGKLLVNNKEYLICFKCAAQNYPLPRQQERMET